MNFKQVLIFFLFFTSLCTTGQVLVKFKNTSKEEYVKLYIYIGGKEFTFSNLESGQATDYISVKGVYPYCPARIITSTDTLAFLPIDYVGERLYTSGKLVMKITILPEDNQRQLYISAKRPLF